MGIVNSIDILIILGDPGPLAPSFLVYVRTATLKALRPVYTLRFAPYVREWSPEGLTYRLVGCVWVGAWKGGRISDQI